METFFIDARVRDQIMNTLIKGGQLWTFISFRLIHVS
jgi:hypothetical protein